MHVPESASLRRYVLGGSAISVRRRRAPRIYQSAPVFFVARTPLVVVVVAVETRQQKTPVDDFVCGLRRANPPACADMRAQIYQLAPGVVAAACGRWRSRPKFSWPGGFRPARRNDPVQITTAGGIAGTRRRATAGPPGGTAKTFHTGHRPPAADGRNRRDVPSRGGRPRPPRDRSNTPLRLAAARGRRPEEVGPPAWRALDASWHQVCSHRFFIVLN
jgi:hypothetical protein